MNRTYTVKEVADILGYSTNSIYTFLKQGRLAGIRLGKGRFRIPQEEVDKLIHLKKNPQITAQPARAEPVSLKSKPVTTPQDEEYLVIPSLKQHLQKTSLTTPSLFDWFISIASIILGITMFVYSRQIGVFSNQILVPYLDMMRINLIIAGIGLLFLDFIGINRKTWYLIFYLILGINYLAGSGILLINKNFIDLVVFGSLVLTIIFHLSLRFKGIISFVLYISLLVILFPFVALSFPGTIDISKLGYLAGFDLPSLAPFWLIFSSFGVIVAWLIGNKRRVQIVLALVTSLGLFAVAYIYGQQLLWAGSLWILLLISFLTIAPFWQDFNLKDRHDEKIVFKLFSNILLIFIIFIVIIWVNQKNLIDRSNYEAESKLASGRSIVETRLTNAEEQLTNIARSKLFLEEMAKDNKLNLDELIKGLFINSKNFRRILVASETGDVLAIYPHTVIPYQNISFRDYFQQVKETKEIYLSDLFETASDNQKINVVVIAIPILDQKENFKGILIGSVDLETLRERLRLLKTDINNEHFEVYDRQGHRLIGQTGDDMTKESYSIVEDKIPATGWRIVFKKTYFSSVSFDKSMIFLIIFSALMANLLIIINHLLYLRNKEG